MKILQLIQKPQNRGAETFASQLANHLIELGHEVKVLAVFNGEAELPFKGEIETMDTSPGKRFFDVSGWKKLANIIYEFNPDIVQANAGDTLKYAVLSRILFKWTAPVVSRNASEVGRYFRSSLQKHLNSFFYKKIDHVISVSEASQNDILNHFPFLKGKTEVIPVGLEEQDNIKLMELEPQDRKHIVHVGGFSFEKNHEGLLRIFKQVLGQKPNVQLHLIGDGPQSQEIKKQAENLNILESLSFYGFLENPLSYIKAADVLVLPSIIEGLPGVLLEAMYCKTPVIAYDVGGISEIVGNCSGKLINKNNEEKFAEAILESLETPNHNQINYAFKMVTQHFMNEQIALKFVNSYQNIVAHQQ